MDRRVKGQSQLDYLWVHFGNKFITSNINEVDPDAIPSIQLIKQLSGGSNAVSTIALEGGYLVAKDSEGKVLSKISTTEFGGLSISEFGRRKITIDDIGNGCTLKAGTGVLYIKLSNGVEYLSEIVTGGETSTAETVVDGYTIYINVKISANTGNVKLSQKYDGLTAEVDIEGVTEQIKEDLNINNTTWIEVN